MTSFFAAALKPIYRAEIKLGTGTSGALPSITMAAMMNGVGAVLADLLVQAPSAILMASTLSGVGALSGDLTSTSPSVAGVISFEILGPTSLDPAGSPAYGIDGNGWIGRMRVIAQAGASPDASKILITVQDGGYEKPGGVITPTTVTRYLIPSAVVRRPAPNQAQALTMVAGAVAAPVVGDAVDYFLSLPEHVYAGSSIVGVEVAGGFYGSAAAGTVAAVTNNSTWDYQDPIVGFMNMPQERVVGGSYNVELFVQHRHARNGQSVAGVEFFASDGVNVGAVSASTLPALSSLQTRESIAEVFKAAVATTALDQASSTSICVVDAIVYPWIGTPYQVSVDGVAWPTAQPCTPLRFTNDKTGGYGGAIAFVKSGVTGGAVGTTMSGARATPFPTINAAITAISIWNNTVSGGHTVAHNDYGGSSIYLMDNDGSDQAFELTGNVTTAAGTCWIDILSDPNNTARAYYQVAVARRIDAGLLRIRCPVEKTGASGAISCNDATQGSSKMLAVMDATVNLAVGTTNPWLTLVGLVYQRNVDYPISGGLNVPALSLHSTSGLRCAQAIGITYGSNGTTQSVNITPYMAIGCSGKFVVNGPSLTAQTTNDGGIFDNCKAQAISVTMNIFGANYEISRGFSFTQSVIEFISGQDFGISASGATVNVKNILCFGLTIPHAAADYTADVGRFNHAYNDVTATRGKTADIVVKYCVSGRFATKTDYFSYYNSGGVVGNVGNFSVAYNVENEGNIMSLNRPATLDGSEYWRKVIDPYSKSNVGPIGYTSNQAGISGATGFGTYSLTGGDNPAYNAVAAGKSWRRYDMAGVLRKNDGTGAAGAYERTV